MNKTVLIVLLVLIGLGVGVLIYMNKYSQPATDTTGGLPQTTATPAYASGTPGVPTGTSGVMDTGTTKEFSVSGGEFTFTPKTLTVSEGDTVKVTFTNNGQYPHNFTIDELTVQSKTIQPGQSDVVTFKAQKAGSYTYYCKVDRHEEQGMTGTLTVQ